MSEDQNKPDHSKISEDLLTPALEAGITLSDLMVEPGTLEWEQTRQKIEERLAGRLPPVLEQFDAQQVARDGDEAMTSGRILRTSALEAESKPGYLAYALGRYRSARAMTPSDLAEYLGLSTDDYAELALSRRPVPGHPRSREELARLAEHFGLDPAVLGAVLAEVRERN